MICPNFIINLILFGFPNIIAFEGEEIIEYLQLGGMKIISKD